MNMYTNTKKSKKFILILVLLILFSFCYPKNVNAALELEDFPAIPAQIFYMAEKGILKYLNNLFTNDEHHTSITPENEEYEAESYSVYLTPENIIKGKFILFDANIFKNIQNSNKYYDDGAFGGAINSGKESLRNVIAGWYYALRNFAIVALLSVLVYVGIRMILSTIAQDKAKYKVMFKDWLVALCLVVVMHYMMIGILNISSMITDALGDGQNSNTIGKLTGRISGVLSESSSTNENGGKDWFDRHYQYEDDEGTYDLGDAYAFILVLAGIIIYTFIFAVKYLKREFTIIFLILLGPVSCITYPIDKISDGKAQAFNKWLSEFLYQVIIQPFHLLLYIVLVGSAVELANKNVIYALVCFAVMIPAEKFIKEMFGFRDKLGSPLGAFAGGALASKAISALTSKGKGSGGSGGKDGDSDNDSVPNELPPRTVDKPGLVDGNTENNGQNPIEGARKTETVAQDEIEEGDSNSKDDVLEAYSAEGFGQNSDGEYFNPWTDEYDSDYDPHNDSSYMDKIKETDNASEEQPKIKETDDASEEQPKINERESNENTEKTSLKDKIANSKAMAIHNQRVSKKYGSTNRKQRWKRRIVKGAKAGAKGLLKGGAIGLVGTAAMAGALMTGNGKEALGIAGGITAYAGKKALNGSKKVIKGATGAAKDYFNAYRDDMSGTIPFVKSREEKALQDFKENKKQQEKAVLSYRKNHKGQEPGYDDLEKEMEDRFTLSRYGLSDDEIDDVLPIYQEKLEKLEDEGKTPEEAENIAGSQAKQTAKLAKFYKPKDFQDSKAMQNAYNYMFKQLKEETKCEDKVADNYARQYLINAARMHGVSEKAVALPSTNKTIDVSIPNGETTAVALGVGNSSDFDDVQLQRLNHLTVRLHEEAHMSSREIEKLAKGTADSRSTTAHVLDTFEAKVEFLTDKQAQKDAREWVAASNKVGTQNVTDKQVKVEMENRLELLSVGAKPEDMNGILATDEALYQSHTKYDRQMALDIAGKVSSRQMNESREMDKLIKDTAKKLVKDGRATGNGIQKATEIVERAANFKGTTAVYTIKE